jgi:hypothetical protein
MQLVVQSLLQSLLQALLQSLLPLHHQLLLPLLVLIAVTNMPHSLNVQLTTMLFVVSAMQVLLVI